jgi:hypothetical protein
MVLGNELRKKLLGQILGLVGAITFAPHIDIDGVPISITEGLQRPTRRLGTLLSGSHDNAPMSGSEDSRGRASQFLLRLTCYHKTKYITLSGNLVYGTKGVVTTSAMTCGQTQAIFLAEGSHPDLVVG